MDEESSPARRAGRTVTRAMGHNGTDAGKARVLLVEDHKDTRFVLQTVLESSGYSVEAVENGQEALHSMEDHVPDIVVTDLMMPVLDGLHLAQAITGENGGRTVPVVLVSERVADSPYQLDLDRFFDAVVLKPVNPTELLNKVSNLLMAR